MTRPQPTPAVQAPRSPRAGAVAGARPRRRDGALRAVSEWPARLAPHHLALAAILAFSAVLNVNRLSQNGYANIFYSAGVKSMLRSLHNFLFVSFDPGGLIMIDKPPLGLWLQVASAKLFGFSPLSLLLPEAICGVLAVAVVYRMLARSFGVVAALAGALVLATFPSFVAVSRDNGVDALLILLMALACDAALRAIDGGRLRTLLWSAALVGLAFNTKTLAAYLIVPPIALAYALCAPGPFARRARSLLAAGLLLAAVSLAWIAVVELSPASSRPFVGGSTDNTQLGLTFGYNGFGRVGGQVNGPGDIPRGSGGLVPSPHVAPAPSGALTRSPHPPGAAPGAAGAVPAKPPSAHRVRAAATRPSPARAGARAREPILFAGPVGPLRLFDKGLGDQGAWLLPFALLGLLAGALVLLAGAVAPYAGDPRRSTTAAGGGGRRGGAAKASPLDRRDPRLAALVVLGGWLLVEAVILSVSKGIVHPYYVSALAPGVAASCGIGIAAFTELAARHWRDWRRLLAPAAVVATLAAQLTLLHREHYMHWFIPLLVASATLACCLLLVLRGPRAGPATVVLTLALLLVAPTAYATSTWLAPVRGTFPAAGPTQAAGAGGVGVGGSYLQTVHALRAYVATHGPASRWALLTDASDTAAPFILLGLNAGSLAGYGGSDPALDGPGLARLVAGGQARYVVLGGEFSTRGGNRALAAVARACAVVPASAWAGESLPTHGLVLFDCAGRSAALAAA